ncbi:MAG: type III-A CRISPR-associated RAMP protein Csm3 [Coleofasciculaceae cyanobacterium SM2_1_6]|nr:type III-A CRISPR-associated RAMP protein Csm3 [Coleofasciculaceae cyanobacterium SM2_1_6]
MANGYLIGKVIIQGTLSLETGLLIGSSDENLDIGGLDKFVVRDPLTRYPYIPGSSVKGKLRSILELLERKAMNRHGGSGIYRYESDDLQSGYTKISGDKHLPFAGANICPVSRIFGSTGGKCLLKQSVAISEKLADLKTGTKAIAEDPNELYVEVNGRNSPARLIVRDMYLTDKSAKRLKEIDTGLFMTERKSENSIDRITSAASPRQFERVPRGSEFNFEMIYTIDDEDKSKAVVDIKNILRTIFVLEDDALGGSGSRGYGKVRFLDIKFGYKDYKSLNADSSVLSLPVFSELTKPIKSTQELSSEFSSVERLILGESKS